MSSTITVCRSSQVLWSGTLCILSSCDCDLSRIFQFGFTVSVMPFKGATIATRQRVNGGGVMIKLSGLSPCLLYSAFYFNSVVCRLLSVSNQKFKQHQWLCLQQRAHNPAYTN